MPTYRAPKDYLFGQLSASATNSTTTLTSNDFTNLPTTYSSTYVLPLALSDDTLKVYEVVWVTGHASSSNQVTVVRGKEGSTAQTWSSGTRWQCAPMQYDGLGVTSRAGLNADPHVGQRRMLNDEGFVVQSTYAQGWQADVGLANPSEYGKTIAGGAIPTWASVIARGNIVNGTTNGSGQIPVTYTTPFPTATLTVVTTWITGSASCDTRLYPGSQTASGFSVYVVAMATGSTVGSGITATFNYIAHGY
ncbi:hypothetical protein GCM10022243_48100 [Saccharothrix violaceirubra]|uniref:Uncharacterized protein n=1 Tax=Saccharothrix violaceirubra TaxID=413306 RepID=A0A7W7SZL3_9PSEU|nr:hypothetical protein [Saccharothrix violaceirubra]MBB4963848.1 hypothetical protein [Saccharothrix violaceirubra]